jgi:hypothetical protein
MECYVEINGEEERSGNMGVQRSDNCARLERASVRERECETAGRRGIIKIGNYLK